MPLLNTKRQTASDDYHYYIIGKRRTNERKNVEKFVGIAKETSQQRTVS